MKELPKNNLSKDKVILGLSGGVDSTTAALLLKKKGLEVIGFYFDALGNNQEGLATARKAAEQLGIEFVHRDVSKEFDSCVISNFCSEYIHGRTPNPCVVCNPTVKFKNLIDVADEKGAYYIATGHYARIAEEDGKCFIRQGASQKKDQSYMLARLGQEYTSRLIFPLGEIDNKDTTRQLARDNNLSNADAADSQEICFIDEKTTDYVEFIKERGFQAVAGDFIDEDGNVLGRHKGLINYTVGQRKGLGVTFGKPMFVLSMNPDNNCITLGSNESLFNKDVYSINNFFCETGDGNLPEKYNGKTEITAKIRYAAKPAKALMYMEKDGRVKTTFDEPQRAATPGQTIVFYHEDKVIGGGFID